MFFFTNDSTLWYSKSTKINDKIPAVYYKPENLHNDCFFERRRSKLWNLCSIPIEFFCTLIIWKYSKYIPQQSNLLTMVTLMTSCMACRSILSQGWKSWDVCASRLEYPQSVMLSTALEAGLRDELKVTGFDTATINIQLNSIF